MGAIITKTLNYWKRKGLKVDEIKFSAKEQGSDRRVCGPLSRSGDVGYIDWLILTENGDYIVVDPETVFVADVDVAKVAAFVLKESELMELARALLTRLEWKGEAVPALDVEYGFRTVLIDSINYWLDRQAEIEVSQKSQSE